MVPLRGPVRLPVGQILQHAGQPRPRAWLSAQDGHTSLQICSYVSLRAAPSYPHLVLDGAAGCPDPQCEPLPAGQREPAVLDILHAVAPEPELVQLRPAQLVQRLGHDHSLALLKLG